MKNWFLSSVLICGLLTVTVLTAAPASAVWPYPDYATFIASFKALATSYPQYVSYETIGKTVLNQDLLMFRVGNPAGGVVLFDGAIHGWESEGSQLLYYYAQWLLTSGDALAVRALARTCTLLVPVVNTDDYSLNRTNAHGVDLNRNFATNWQYGGSTDPNSEYYRGPSPLSEPESQAMSRVFQNRRPDAYINVHDGGGEIIYPNSYNNSTYRSAVFSKINSLSAQRGVATYDTTVISGPGYSTSDAARAGTRTSLLFEIGNGTRTIPEVISSVLPRFIPYAIILSQESENNVLVTDGFEAADFRNWDGNQTTQGESISTSKLVSREGQQSARFTADGNSSSEAAYCNRNLDSATTLYARGYFLPTVFTATGNYSRFYFAALAASGQTVAMAGCLKTGSIFYWRLAVYNCSDWVIVDSGAGEFLNQWHRFELQWTQSPTDGYGKLYVDNQQVCSISRINTTTFGPVNSVQFGIAMSGNAETTLYLDYVQVSRISLGPLPIPEDLNQDRKVDMHDISMVACAFGTVPVSSQWEPRADLNADSKIDMTDVAHVAYRFGQQTP